MSLYSDLNVKCSHCTRKFQGATHLLLHFFEHIDKFPVEINPRLKSELINSIRANEVNDRGVLKKADNLVESNHSSVEYERKPKFERQNSEEKVSRKETLEKHSNTIYEKQVVEKVDKEGSEEEKTCAVDAEPNAEANGVHNSTNADDFNPLTFCVITMDASDGNFEYRKSYTKQILPKNLDCKSTKISEWEKLPSSSKKRNYYCHFCTKTFGWMTDLKRHILTHTGERPFKCPKCDIAFTRKFLLQRHISKIHSNKLPNEDSTILEKKVKENLNQLSRTTAFKRRYFNDNKLYRDNNNE